MPTGMFSVEVTRAVLCGTQHTIVYHAKLLATGGSYCRYDWVFDWSPVYQLGVGVLCLYKEIYTGHVPLFGPQNLPVQCKSFERQS